METFFPQISLHILMLTTLITLLAGVVKGVVGFAMPMVMISGLTLILPPEVALATLILPTLVANLAQALRQGPGAAVASIMDFRLFIAACLIFLLISAQLVRILPQAAMFLLIGGPVVAFALLQLSGWKGHLAQRSRPIEVVVGGFAGFVGGISGVWGPPLVAYLTAIGTPKIAHIRAQGVIYAICSVALFGAHLQSGVLRTDTAPLSVLMILPAMIGMWLGLRIQDRFDQTTFRRATLFVLLVAGLNLVRRGLF